MLFGCEISFNKIFSGYLSRCISGYHLKPSHHLTIDFKLPSSCGRKDWGVTKLGISQDLHCQISCQNSKADLEILVAVLFNLPRLS